MWPLGSEIRLKQLAVGCQIARRGFAIHIAAAAVAGLALALLVAVFG